MVERRTKERLEHAFILKTLPESRVEIIIGKKSQRDVQFICFIADDLYLIKLFETSHWTIMDTIGKLRNFPKKLKDLLSSFGNQGPSHVT